MNLGNNLSKMSFKAAFRESVCVKSDTGCWEWQRSIAPTGYGRIHIFGKTFGVHRLAYETFIGEIPKGQLVCHACDNPVCCNPEHLFLGTPRDNQRDMTEKGRGRVGENNGRAKITGDIVLQIREEYAKGGVRQVDLGKKYGLPQITVSNIITKRTWKHI